MRYFVLKEFYKFKFAFFVFALATVFCCAWVFFDIKGGMDKFGAVNYTLRVMYNKYFSYNHLDEINIFFALIIGASSMFYERQAARIRVQFHYPHSYLKNTLMLTLIPLCFLLAVFAFELIAIFFILNTFFTIEIVTALVSTLIYSCLFSIGVFFLTQSMVIEPDLKRIFANLCVLLGAGYIYFKINPDVGNSSYYYLNDNLWAYIFIFMFFAILSLLFALSSYKKGYIK